MSESKLKQTIGAHTVAAMKARDRQRLGVLRLINSEIKRVEVDERRTLSDQDVVSVLNRMVKQRQDSLSQYEAAGREDLAEQERYEIDVVREFLPEPLDDDALEGLIVAAIRDTGAQSMRDMGKVMNLLRPQVEGRADMAVVSGKVKAKLG
ncbi:MAG TPA: GatB/YqeY domain-containing protein [Pseudomonadales bacterium]